MLPERLQDVLPEGHGAEGQTEEGRRIRQRPPRRWRPSCLIVDEVGWCTFDKACTDLFFDVVDRRYEKDCANTMILTSNTPTNNWDEFFTGDDTLLCTLDRLFDRASVFVMKGASFRGAELEIFSVETTPLAVRATA